MRRFILYPIGRQLSKISWHNYIIPNRYWRIVLGKQFGGTYMGIPIYLTEYLSDHLEIKKGGNNENLHHTNYHK